MRFAAIYWRWRFFESAGNGRRRKVPIADDREVAPNVLKTMLKKLGTCDVVTAKGGKAAPDILTASDAPFDLVLTDMRMPVTDGAEQVRAGRNGRFFSARLDFRRWPG